MTISKRLIALLMALAMCFALAACQSGEGAPSADPSQSQSATPSDDASGTPEIVADLTQTLYEFSSGLKDGDTAVTINGVAVPNEQFLYWLSYNCYYMSSYYAQLGMTPDFSEAEIAEFMISDTQEAVTYYAVMRQMCQENGITITDEQEAELQRQIDEYVTENGEGSFESLLQSYGLSEASFRDINSNSFLFTNLADSLMGEPTQADLEQYVADQGIFSVKHILLTVTEDDVTDDDGNVTQTADDYNASQKALAEDLLQQLQNSDDMETLFDELMNQYSEDSGLSSNPDGYTFTSSDSLVGGFREAALELAAGELSGIVETDYGYHIMLRLPVNSADYRDDWVSTGTDSQVLEALEAAEVTLSDGIAGLDVASFYERYVAYVTALYSDDTADQ